MSLQDDLQRLIHPNTTDTEIIEICKQYELDLEESQLSNTQALQILESQITDHSPNSQKKRQVVYVLLYRAGEDKYTTMVKEGNFNLFELDHKIKNIFQLLDPKIKTFEGKKSLEYIAYHTLINALGVGNIRALPLWLQIILYKAFALPAGTLNEEDYNHESAAAGKFDIKNIMRLAEMLHTGVAKKESQEKLALAAWGKVYQTDRKFICEGTTAEEAIIAYKNRDSIATAVASIQEDWFKPYEKFPLPLLFKIGNAYKEQQAGTAANAYAAALCYALVWRLQSEHVEAKEELAIFFVEAKQGLEKCFNEGGKHLPANLITVKSLQAFYTAQALPAATDTATAASSSTPSEMDKFIVSSVLTNDEATETKRLNSFQDPGTLPILTALDILGIEQDLLSSPKLFTPSFTLANSELITQPSRIQSVVEQIKEQRNKKFKSLKRHSNYLSALQTVEEFIALSNKLALEAHCSDPEAFSPASSLYEKIRQYGETIKSLEKTKVSDSAFIQAATQGLLQGIATIEELNAFLERINKIKAHLPSLTKNPFAPTTSNTISWFPAEITKLSKLGAPDSALTGAMQFFYKKFNEYMKTLNETIEVFSGCLRASEESNYTDELEKLLEFWDQDKAISLLGKIFSSTEDHKKIAQTKARLEAATRALETFTPSAATQATETKLDTLESILKGASAQIRKHHNIIALTFQKITTFIEQERQAKNRCKSLKILEKQEALTWQDTELQYLINKKAEELRALTLNTVRYNRWRALIEGLRTKNILGFTSENLHQIYVYLELPQVLKRTEILTAMGRLETELRAFKDIESLIAQDNTDLAYPTDTDNDYTRARNNAFNFNFEAPRHFETQLPLFRKIRAAEIHAKQEMKELVSQIVRELSYTEDSLRGFINQQLRTHTYQESLPILTNWFGEEKKARDFLNPYLPTARHETAFVNWLTHLPGAQDILQQILGKTKSYSQALTALNTNVQGDYERVVAEYDKLEAAYRSRYKLFSPSQNRLDKIAELLAYKERIVSSQNLQTVEQYGLLLGALKKAHDDVLELHILGQQRNNSSASQFFKRHITSSELAEVLEASLSVSAPSIVQHGFFGNTRVLTAPILTTTQQLHNKATLSM